MSARTPTKVEIEREGRRERGTGRFGPKHGRPCRCGHLEHTAARVKFEGVVQQPCLEAGCTCELYTPVRQRKAVAS